MNIEEVASIGHEKRYMVTVGQGYINAMCGAVQVEIVSLIAQKIADDYGAQIAEKALKEIPAEAVIVAATDKMGQRIIDEVKKMPRPVVNNNVVHEHNAQTLWQWLGLSY